MGGDGIFHAVVAAVAVAEGSLTVYIPVHVRFKFGEQVFAKKEKYCKKEDVKHPLFYMDLCIIGK